MIEKVIDTVLKAGEEVLSIYRRSFEVEYKDDKTPVTEADRKSHSILVSELKHILNVPILSEEGKEIPHKTRKSWKRFWLIDPLDGTKEFIKRNGEFTINIALIEERYPVLGIIYIPAREVLYFAEKGKGAYKTNIREGKIADIEKISHRFENGKIKVVASRSHRDKNTEDFIKKLENIFGDIETISAGSSLKFCLLAEGKADIYPRFGPTMEWDTAAGHIIAEECGCSVKSIENGTFKEFSYNKESLLNPHFVVFRKEVEELVIKALVD